jgi:hypothetical protein
MKKPATKKPVGKKPRVYTNGTEKGESFAARFKPRVKKMLKDLDAVGLLPRNFTVHLNSHWQFVAVITLSSGVVDGHSIKSPDHAIAVLEKNVAARVLERLSHNVDIIARAAPQLGSAVKAMLSEHGLL